jgi:CRP/FNR family transcriptional regulator, cyclic AMP receptor protein
VNVEERRGVLMRCALFGGLDEAALDRLGAGMQPRRFRRREVVFHAEDPGDALHVVADGTFKVVLPSEGGDDAMIAVLERGAFFGELSLLDGAPRSATVSALTDAGTLVLHRDAFRRILDADTKVRDGLLGAIAREVRHLTWHVEDLHFLDLPGRLASQIVRLADGSANGSGDGLVTISWPYTQAEVAAMIGATRQSANRLLASLVADGLVRLDGDTLVVPDLHRLNRRARW